MEAKELYKKLDKDFDLDNCKDEWDMDYNEFISENFKKRQMGLLVDNSEEVDYVYTAVFPSDKVLNEILGTNKENVLLFTHHPMNWDIRKENVFTNINKDLLKKLKERKISIYTLHVPLDKNGEYSTTYNLSKVLGISKEGEFCEYYGVKVGIIGKTEFSNVVDLKNKVSSVLGHDVKLCKYGKDEINNNKVALVAGGGNDLDTLKEIVKLNINTFVTGITALNDFSKEAHEYARENKINIIGGTHYSTEKFSCISMIDYFKKIGLNSEFIEDEPIMEDMG